MATTANRKTRASVSLREVQKPLKSVHNLRRVDAHGKLYRSARQDSASPEDIRHFQQTLGIRTYLDMRNAIEYRNSIGRKPKPIDREVNIFVPEIPDAKTLPYPATNAIPLKGVDGKPAIVNESPKAKPTRYLIDMFPKEWILQVFNTAPLYKKLFALLLYIVDVILANHYKYFVRCFSGEISRLGLDGRYMGMLNHGGKQLCFMLRTLSNPENLPAVLSCAHGKDRTGIVTALILSILGKSDEYIAEEYALSEEGLKPMGPALREELVLKYRLDESFGEAKKETMLKVLRALKDRYGSVEAYLESIGFTREEQENLRRVLS